MVWNEILDRIYNGEKKIPSPFTKDAFIEYYYVVYDEVNRRGFFLAWCPVSLKGIQVSSVKVPSHLTYITIDEFKKTIKVPEVEWMDPTK